MDGLAAGGGAAAILVSVILPKSIWPYLIMMLAGFVIGTWGHMARSKWTVAVGIALIFLAAFVFPLATVLVEETPAPPDIGPEVQPPGLRPE